MKRALLIALLVVVLFAAFSIVATPAAKADGPYGYWYYPSPYVFPGSGYNRVCMYRAYNCVYRYVPPFPVHGYYRYPYNTWYRPYGYMPYYGHWY